MFDGLFNRRDANIRANSIGIGISFRKFSKRKSGASGGIGSGGAPSNAYTAENGTTYYVAEDGSTYYVQEPALFFYATENGTTLYVAEDGVTNYVTEINGGSGNSGFAMGMLLSLTYP